MGCFRITTPLALKFQLCFAVSRNTSYTFFNSSEIDEDEDDDDNDEDSEPILGKWFADTLFPPDEDTSGLKDVTGDEQKPKTKRHASDASGALLVPQKGEPAGFVSLASHVFIFLNKHIVNCESKFVRNYIRAGLTEQQVCSTFLLSLKLLK